MNLTSAGVDLINYFQLLIYFSFYRDLLKIKRISVNGTGLFLKHLYAWHVHAQA